MLKWDFFKIINTDKYIDLSCWISHFHCQTPVCMISFPPNTSRLLNKNLSKNFFLYSLVLLMLDRKMLFFISKLAYMHTYTHTHTVYSSNSKFLSWLVIYLEKVPNVLNAFYLIFFFLMFVSASIKTISVLEFEPLHSILTLFFDFYTLNFSLSLYVSVCACFLLPIIQPLFVIT